MASEKRIPCWFLLLVFLCLVGFTEAIRKTPSPPLLLDSRPENANERGASMQGVVVAEPQTVVTEQADIEEERRILLAEGKGMMGNTMDYATPGPNRDHDPKGHH